MNQTAKTRRQRGHRMAAIALLVLAASGCSHAAEPPAKGAAVLHAERGWIRATPPNAPVAGGYLTLRNAGTTDDRLVGVSAPDAERVELHEMRMERGAMQMRALPQGIPVKGGATVELKPGGTHLMFIGPKRAFKAGDQVQVTLKYAHAPSQTLAFPVQPLGSTAAPAMEMPMDGDHMHH